MDILIEIFLFGYGSFKRVSYPSGWEKDIIFYGHKGHVTIQAIELAIQMDIEIVCILPHSKHRLQPLDVAVGDVYYEVEYILLLFRLFRILVQQHSFWTKILKPRGSS